MVWLCGVEWCSCCDVVLERAVVKKWNGNDVNNTINLIGASLACLGAL